MIGQLGTNLLVCLCLVFTVPSAQAEENQNILDRFTGDWTAVGNSFGDTIKTEMKWSKSLSDQFRRIDYKIYMEKPFVGVGHYKISKDQTTSGYWVDNGGELHPLSVTLTDNAIITIWGMVGDKQGRTEYRLESEDRAMVTDWILTAGGWRLFNQAEFVLMSPDRKKAED